MDRAPEPVVVEVAARVDAQAEDAFCALLGDAAAHGWASFPAGRGRVRVVLYVDAAHDGAVRKAVEAMERAAARLARQWPEHGHVELLAPSAVAPGWRDAWRRWFRPMRIAPGIVVGPPWEHGPWSPGVHYLEIEPGVAFGTGLHATTRLALRLGQPRAPGARVCDVGTGSGVLAIALALLGARRVAAVDVDPLAVDAARANAARNAVDDIVRVELGSARDAGPGPYDLVVANIVSPVLEELRDDLVGLLADEGCLVLSGILEPEAASVGEAFAAAGLVLDERLDEDGWVALRLCAPASS